MSANRKSPFETYIDYLALKNHFSRPSYDYQRYEGKVKANVDSFEKRPDRFHFTKLSRHKDAHHYLLANLLDTDRWIGDMTEARYADWARRNQSLSYLFSQELGNLAEDFNSNFAIPPSIPRAIVLYYRRQISPETLTILLDILQLWEYYTREMDGDVLWETHSIRLRKYVAFLAYDKPKFKALILAKWSKDGTAFA